MKSILIYISLAGLLLVTACSKNINLILPQPPNLMVVEGHVEPGGVPYVYLSHNFAFFGNTSITNIISQDVIHNALIIVNDGATSDTMTEVLPSFGYYEALKMRGQVGRTYKLTVTAQGQTVTATTSILTPIKLDSAWFEVKQGLDTLGYMWAILSDPPAPGNCYRWFAKRLGKDTIYIAPDGSVFNDQLINGKKFEFFYDRGHLPGSKAPDDTNRESHYFKTGEKVVIKFCAIDNVAYQFFSSYYFQQNNTGNPFGSPAPVPGNIQGGLGIWCGYGASFDTVICK